MANEALFTQGGTYDASELRKLIKGIWYSPSPGGVIDGMAVTVAGALSIAVAPGFAKIDDATNGAYLGYSTATNNVAISSNSGGGSTRNDTIYALVNDPGAGGTAGELSFAVATGTTTIPALAIPLANVAVTTGNAMTVTAGARQTAEPMNAAARGASASLAARLAGIDASLAQAVTLTGTQTVTNKDLTSPSNLFPTGVVLPPGMIVPYAGDTAPTSWVLCAGQAISRTGANAGLFAVIGTTYGPGDGSTTFNVPDLRGRVPAGADSMGGTAAGRMSSFSIRGLIAGAQSIVQSIAQMAPHSHSISVGGNDQDHWHGTYAHSHGGSTGTVSVNHTHLFNFQYTDNTAGGGTARRVTDIGNRTGGGGTSAQMETSGFTANHTHGIAPEAPNTGGQSNGHSHAASAATSGSGQAMSVVQPTLAVHYIIKL